MVMLMLMLIFFTIMMVSVVMMVMRAVPALPFRFMNMAKLFENRI